LFDYNFDANKRLRAAEPARLLRNKSGGQTLKASAKKFSENLWYLRDKKNLKSKPN